MKKLILPLVILIIAISSCFIAPCYAKKFVNYRTYEIVEVTENSITMRYKDGKEYILHWKPKGLKVGDKVRYDRRRHKLKRTPIEQEPEN